MASFIGLPDDLKYDFASWNPMTPWQHQLCCLPTGDEVSVATIRHLDRYIYCMLHRIAWFVGVSRKTYYYGKHATKIEKDSKAS